MTAPRRSAYHIYLNVTRRRPPHGRLLIVEAVLPPGDAPHQGKMMDLLMLTITGGLERTADEFAALLAEAGYRLTRVVPISVHQSMLEAVPGGS